ncbi:MAG: hypothetical protein IPO17_07955 [Flavobacteriales bacterium]|nr:hypothetical protein [Flavobacteriales bacterium]
MKRNLLSLTAIATAAMAFGQAQIVMNNAAGPIYMVFNNPVVADATNQTWLVIDHAQTNGITLNTAALPGGVRSENEFNMIRWRIAAALGAYTIPYNSPLPAAPGTNIPFTYDKTSAGTGVGSVVFSSYNYGTAAAPANNYLYRPSDVTHVSDDPTGASVSSGAPYAVDRFWIVDTKAAGFAYGTNPNATLSFTSLDAEITGGNSITAATTLAAQRFNNVIDHWGDVFYPSSNWILGVTPGTHIVNSVADISAEHYRSWTLSDLNNPLPVELTTFDGSCNESKVVLKWTTASEINNSHFDVEKSDNGIDWSVVGTVNGAGNSQETINYNFVVANDGNMAYYRLKQVDTDGGISYSTVITAGCDVADGTELVSVWDNGAEVQLMVSSTVEGVYDVTLMDTHSKALTTVRNQTINKGITYLTIPKSGIATGMYMVRMHNQTEQFSRKVVLN